MFGIIYFMHLFINGAGANFENFIHIWKGYGLSLWDLITFFLWQIPATLVPLVFYKSFKGFGGHLSKFVNIYRTHPFLMSGTKHCSCINNLMLDLFL